MNRITDYGKLATDISNWIKQYAEDNNIKSLVIGVSGGIDSAVVSALCAMTGIKTRCCSIAIHTAPEHLQIATRHTLWLKDVYPNVEDIYKDLTEEYDLFMGNFVSDDYGMGASTKSRLRMTMLYAISKYYNNDGMVVGTGNKVEDFGVGFFTVGGDGCVSISPIADLYKTEVRELGRHLGISQEILDAAPTDGLWGDQQRTDEDCLGATYEELEWVMEELGAMETITVDDIVPFKMVDPTNYTERQLAVINIYTELHNKNQHKMLPIPIYKLPI
jgi:NAD+ synthase